VPILSTALDESAGTLSEKEGSAVKKMTDKERAQTIKKLVQIAATSLRRAAVLAERMEDNNGWFLARCLEILALDAEDNLGWIKHWLNDD
jgi:hypothetical protein